MHDIKDGFLGLSRIKLHYGEGTERPRKVNLEIFQVFPELTFLKT